MFIACTVICRFPRVNFVYMAFFVWHVVVMGGMFVWLWLWRGTMDLVEIGWGWC